MTILLRTVNPESITKPLIQLFEKLFGDIDIREYQSAEDIWWENLNYSTITTNFK